MKKIITLNIILLLTTVSFGQTRKSFEQLFTGQVNYYEEATFSIDSANSIIYNGKFTELKSTPEGFTLEDFVCEIGSTIIADVLLDKSTNKRAILTFGVCPEFEFYLYDLKTKKLIQSFSALNITIPGNGAVYTSGHLMDFNLRRKFSFDEKTFVEDKQPFYYVGLNSKTLREIKIYSDKAMTKRLATLPVGYEIEILLAEKPFDNKIYLVRTSFGLTGWASLQSEQYKSLDVEGLFYNND